jgi:hypothetical protein
MRDTEAMRVDDKTKRLRALRLVKEAADAAVLNGDIEPKAR